MPGRCSHPPKSPRLLVWLQPTHSHIQPNKYEASTNRLSLPLALILFTERLSNRWRRPFALGLHTTSLAFTRSWFAIFIYFSFCTSSLFNRYHSYDMNKFIGSSEFRYTVLSLSRVLCQPRVRSSIAKELPKVAKPLTKKHVVELLLGHKYTISNLIYN